MRGTSNACLLCRRRKLKCDRNRPCANCIARSVSCEQQVLHSRGRQNDSVAPATDRALSSMLSRLDQLEAVTNALQHERSSHACSAPISRKLNSLKRTVPVQEPAARLNEHNISEETFVSTDRASMTNYFPKDNPIRSVLMDDITICISEEWKSTSTHERIQLPPKQEVIQAFQLYFKYVGPFQEILYEPHTRALIEEAYQQVSYAPTTLAPRGLALILCIIAISIVVEPLQGRTDTGLADFKDRLKTSALYIRATMDCLEQQRRKMTHTLESVQAILVLQFLTHHIEIFSYRALFAEAVTISHNLGLHLLDVKPPRGSALHDGTDRIAAEMERRVWWYLAATDWMAAMLEGPSKAVYLVQPRLCCTNIPKHVNCSDLSDPDTLERPLSEPTSMSYNLQRLKVAELARCISETVPFDVSLASCELIMSLDMKIEALILELPVFFSFEKADSSEVSHIDQAHRYIPMQRVVINLIINLIRCQLHFPYISRDAGSPLQAVSREAGVKAACKLLDAHHEMATQVTSPSADFMVHGAAFHLFVGAVIMVTDLVCNQPNSIDRQQELAKLSSAFEKLKRVKEESRPAAALYDKLSRILTSHSIQSLPETASQPTDNETALQLNEVDFGNEGNQDYDAIFSFDEIWDTYMENMPFDTSGFC